MTHANAQAQASEFRWEFVKVNDSGWEFIRKQNFPTTISQQDESSSLTIVLGAAQERPPHDGLLIDNMQLFLQMCMASVSIRFRFPKSQRQNPNDQNPNGTKRAFHDFPEGSMSFQSGP